eukprot:8703813-Prorocentrum_lima.AAC.1
MTPKRQSGNVGRTMRHDKELCWLDLVCGGRSESRQPREVKEQGSTAGAGLHRQTCGMEQREEKHNTQS